MACHLRPCPPGDPIRPQRPYEPGSSTMDAPPPQPPEHRDVPAGPPEADRLASLIEVEAPDAFDRRLVDLACGPGGPGFVHARLLRWDERIEAFHVAAQFGGPPSLRVLMHVIAPESIGAAAEHAWRTDEPSYG